MYFFASQRQWTRRGHPEQKTNNLITTMRNRRRQNHGKIRAHGTVFSGNMSQRSRTAVEIAQDEAAVEMEHFPLTSFLSSPPKICPAQRFPGAELAGRILLPTMTPTAHRPAPMSIHGTRQHKIYVRRYSLIKKKTGKPQNEAPGLDRELQDVLHVETSPDTPASTWHEKQMAKIPPEAAVQVPTHSFLLPFFNLSDEIIRARGKQQQQAGRAAPTTKWLSLPRKINNSTKVETNNKMKTTYSYPTRSKQPFSRGRSSGIAGQGGGSNDPGTGGSNGSDKDGEGRRNSGGGEEVPTDGVMGKAVPSTPKKMNKRGAKDQTPPHASKAAAKIHGIESPSTRNVWSARQVSKQVQDDLMLAKKIQAEEDSIPEDTTEQYVGDWKTNGDEVALLNLGDMGPQKDGSTVDHKPSASSNNSFGSLGDEEDDEEEEKDGKEGRADTDQEKTQAEDKADPGTFKSPEATKKQTTLTAPHNDDQMSL